MKSAWRMKISGRRARPNYQRVAKIEWLPGGARGGTKEEEKESTTRGRYRLQIFKVRGQRRESARGRAAASVSANK